MLSLPAGRGRRARGLPRAAGRARRGVEARGERREDRLEPAERRLVAADHEAEAALEAEDAAARAAVEVVDPALGELARPSQIVSIVRVAAVHDRVAGREQLRDLPHRTLRHLARGEHEPDGARRLECGDELVEPGGSGRSLADQRRHGVRAHVVDDAAVAVAHEPARDVRAHAAQADDAELRCCVRRHVARRLRFAGP